MERKGCHNQIRNCKCIQRHSKPVMKNLHFKSQDNQSIDVPILPWTENRKKINVMRMKNFSVGHYICGFQKQCGHLWPRLSSKAFTRPVASSLPNSNIVRPIAKVAATTTTSPVKMEDARDVAQLSLGLSPPQPSQLTAKLLDSSSRHSAAFHVNSSFPCQ